MKKESSGLTLPTTTGKIRPQLAFNDFHISQKAIFLILMFVVLVGFFIRVQNLGVESLSEDELNKLQTVNEYRTSGLTGKNGEHPFLMKGLQTLSIIAAEKINETFWRDSPISEESALRFPTVVIGSLTILIIFLFIDELFGPIVGLLTAILWAIDPNAIGFNRIAKEDSFLLFFFLLGSYLWLVSQKQAENGEEKWEKYVWLSAIAFGAMMASKYMPHLLGIVGAYYNIFQKIPTTKWRLGKIRWLKFFAVMGLAFVIFNPTILLPETWQQMLTFSTEKRIGHDGYEFMGEIYRNQMSLWFNGVPWTFYFVFILVKTPLLTLIFSFFGLISIFRRKFGDGRFFVFFWLVMWFFPFSVLGGKFVRYFTLVQPLILFLAAVGALTMNNWLKERLFSKYNEPHRHSLISWLIPVCLIAITFISNLSFAPYYRLYTNSIGGGKAQAGNYFPHDEFYDGGTAQTVAIIVASAIPNSRVANETPHLFEYYFAKAGRTDLISISLSDGSEIRKLSKGDFIVAAKGRRYFSNRNILVFMENSQPVFGEVKFGEINAVKVYRLDQTTVENIISLAR